MASRSGNPRPTRDIEELRDQIQELTQQVRELSVTVRVSPDLRAQPPVPIALPARPRDSLRVTPSPTPANRVICSEDEPATFYGVVWKDNPQWDGIYTKYKDYSVIRPGPTFHKRFRTIIEAERFVRERTSVAPSIIPLRSRPSSN